MNNLSVLYVGDMSVTARSLLWHDAIKDQVKHVSAISFEKMNDMGEKIIFKDLLTRVRGKAGLPKDVMKANAQIRQHVEENDFDFLWVNKMPMLWPSTLEFVKRLRPNCKIVFYSEDDMYAKHNRTRFFDRCVPLFDVIFTTKSYNCDPGELPSLGAKKVIFVDKAFQKHRHKPYEQGEGADFGAPVGFIGTYEKERANSMLYLAQNGIPIRIWGNHWPQAWFSKHPNLKIEGKALYGENYPRAICATQINLAFLRKANRDLQTDRSMEIPACGAFMLTERTPEHLSLLEEGVEAEFFDLDEELLKKVRFYLDKPQLCRQIGAAGRLRCLNNGYDMHSRINKMIAQIA